MAASRVLGVCFSVSLGECLICILECVCIHPSVFSACTHIHFPKIREDAGQERQWPSWSWSDRQGLGYLSACSGPYLILHSNSSPTTLLIWFRDYSPHSLLLCLSSRHWHVLFHLAKTPFIPSLLKDGCSSLSKVQRPRNTLAGNCASYLLPCPLSPQLP